MSFRFKLLTWIIAVNVVITGLLLWAILSNISAQSTSNAMVVRLPGVGIFIDHPACTRMR